MFSTYVYETIFTIVFFLIAIILWLLPIYEGYGIAVGILSVIVPSFSIWLRHCFAKLVKKQTKKYMETMSSYKIYNDYFQILNNENITDQDIIQIIEKALYTLKKSPVRTETLRGELERLSQGFYDIANPRAIYNHNSQWLRKLKENQHYKTTHHFMLNKFALSDDHEKTIESYDELIEAHCEASINNVKVERIYIFESEQQFELVKNSKQNYINDIKRLIAAEVDVKILFTQTYEPGEKYWGVTIIGDDILGINQSDPSSMTCRYAIKEKGVVVAEYNEYIEKYKKMYNKSMNWNDVCKMFPWIQK